MVRKGALLVLCLALASLPHATMYGMPAVAMLLAVTASGLTEWLSASRLAALPTVMFMLLAMFVPDCRAYLPLVACDAGTPTVWRNGGRAIASSSRIERALLLAAQWLWVPPLVPLMVGACYGGEVAPVALVVAATYIGFLWGADSRDAMASRRKARVLADRLRESSRSTRLRMADVDEDRAQSVRMATLAERSRIARDIHDNVGHLLTRAIMQAQAGLAVAAATGDDTAARGFRTVGATLDDAMTMVRRSVHDMEDDSTDFIAQIDDAAHSLRSASGSARGIDVRLENTIDAAPAPVARCLATVIRESLANVAHHSRAREARVILRDFPEFWQLVVCDPGPAEAVQDDGDDGGVGAPPRGMGIADIESRVRTLDGTAHCGPYDGGWRVFVSIPKARWAATGDETVNGTISKHTASKPRYVHES
nr:histidine kinase [Bifidobacterium leontopitheci]